MTVSDAKPDLQAWIGTTETADCVVHPEPLAGLRALLDHDPPPWSDNALPPLAHWLYFLPRARRSEIGEDGHPRRGGFLPPVELPRRMWAGGEIVFDQAIPIGAHVQRRSMIMDVRQKLGSTGALVFVVVEHRLTVEDRPMLTERQDIVYRQPPSGEAAVQASTAPVRKGDIEREMRLGPVDLFRFSALTFNAHRIHYDRPYAREVEGYAGLVVHGPFIATLLMDHLLQSRPGAVVERFSFRGLRPLLDTAPFTLCLSWQPTGATLWCRDAAGQETMTAEAVLR